MTIPERLQKKISPEESKKLFFSSDSHFHHSNIIKYCGRPFETAEDMNTALVENWNSVIGPDDHVYHLGDFCFGNVEKWNQFLEPGVLNGHIHLIIGNHDMERLFRDGMNLERFEEITFQKCLSVDRWLVYLNHFPFLDFSGNFDRNVMQLYGHTHEGPNNGCTMNNERLSMVQWNQYNVGVDNNDYKPVSWETVLSKIIERKNAELGWG